MSETLCNCKEISYEKVIKAVKNGADTVEKVTEETGAGEFGCCHELIEDIIENNK